MKVIIYLVVYSFSIHSFAQTINYSYDNLGRIIRAEYPDSSIINYSYDASGNRLTQTIIGNANIYGAVKSELGTPIPTVTVDLLTSSGTKGDLTANDGFYGFNVAKGNSYTITPSKNNDVSITNGVSTFDLILMQAHILFLDTLSPYQIIAGDVNSSNSLTTLDIVVTRSFILRRISMFPNNRLWAFVRSDFRFSNLTQPFPYENFRSYNPLNSSKTDADFIGMKLGDVNNSWDMNTPKTDVYDKEVYFTFGDISAQQEEEVIMPVRVRQFENMRGYQFTLSWDASVLSFIEIEECGLQCHFGEQRAGEGMLSMLWTDETGGSVNLEDGSELFGIRFKVIGANGTESVVNITSDITPIEAVNGDLQLVELKIEKGSVIVSEVQSAQGWNLSVQPNPFTNSTNIIFTLPQDETVNIVIYDLLGKEVKNITADYKEGTHSLEWAGNDELGNSLSNGLYHVRMVAGEHTLSRKAVMMRWF